MSNVAQFDFLLSSFGIFELSLGHYNTANTVKLCL